MSLQAACMEPTVVSSPPGAAHWEPFPLGFQTLDPDEPGHAGSGFSREDEEDTLQEDLITVSSFSFEGGHSNISRDDSCFKGLSFKDDFEGLDEISDSTLSWLFSPARKESTLTPESPPDTSSSLCVQGDLISLSVPSSPSNVSRRNSASDEGEPFWLLDLSDELPGDSSGDLHAQVVAEEQEGLPPSQSRKTLTPETRDEVLFPDQVTDLPLTGIAAEQGLSESCRSPDHSREPPEGLAGPVPLLNLDVPDFDSGAGSAVRAAVPNDVSAEMSAAPAEAAVIGPVPPAEGSENGSVPLAASDRLSFLTLPVEEDVRLHNESNSVALMEDQNSLTAITEPDQERMAFDPCLTVEEVHGDSWDVGGANVPPSDHHQPASLDPSAQDVNVSSQEARWTNEQAVETIQRSETPANARQENASPLKAVFDALDQDGDGFVRIEEFMAFAAAYGADQVKDFTKFLDPSGLGVISFEDFHRGISAISNGGPEPQLYDYSPGDGAVGCPEEYDEQNEVTDSAYLGSESTYSECETFTDEDTAALVPPEMHEDVETDSGIEATLHDAEDGGSRFSLNSELHSHSLVTVISGEEEHFEDFGESNTSELEGSVGDADSALAPPADQVDGSAVVSPSAGKRLSSKKVARHLLQNSSMTLDTMSDLTRDILELADNDITDKVLLLERRVAELEKESETSGEQHARLRQENLHLVHRANALEEQLKEQELQTDERLQQESRRHKEALSKLEREKGLELENLQARLQQLDEENGELRSCVPCLRANIERLEEEKRKLQDEVETVSDRLDEETESRRKMADKLSHERHQNQKEKESTQELIEDLRKQLEHLQLYKLEAEAKRGRTPGAGLQEYQSRTREAELEQEIKRLKQDNRTLKEQNDELNGQIINLSIQGAKNLMSTSFSDSLAAEINSVSRAELMEAVHKQEEINYRLQDYIDKIIVAIMECNPSMLEVK